MCLFYPPFFLISRLYVLLSVQLAVSLPVSAVSSHSEWLAPAAAAPPVAAPPRASTHHVLSARAEAGHRRQGALPHRHLHIGLGKASR